MRFLGLALVIVTDVVSQDTEALRESLHMFAVAIAGGVFRVEDAQSCGGKVADIVGVMKQQQIQSRIDHNRN